MYESNATAERWKKRRCTDMMKEIKALNADFYRQHRPLKDRTYGEMHDPVEPGQIGQNGGRIGYMPNGDKVEWLGRRG